MSEMIAAVRAYLDLVEAPPSSSEARLLALAEALDRLALAYHHVTETDLHYEVPDRLPDSGSENQAAVGRRFPELGFYAAAWEEIGAPTTAGDAIDDLIDIADELHQVQSLWDSGLPQDANNQFRASYRFHWGRHLQNLRGHLHALLYER